MRNTKGANTIFESQLIRMYAFYGNHTYGQLDESGAVNACVLYLLFSWEKIQIFLRHKNYKSFYTFSCMYIVLF